MNDPEQLAKAEAAFAKLDANKDGFVTADEIKSAIVDMMKQMIPEGMEVPPEAFAEMDAKIGELIAEIDTNADGKVSFDEFKAACAEKGLPEF